ncbi:uncharacterized protein STEHIDRAFT_116252 [Stereum hirsutum FP-91666 SS1]|uniref:Uncharacterized protein n=1 Tax=Stereum hirsutum (strain FP-91666) TaxID=721885 RepID=R7RWS3_STEHR|nr:uncharacterized protein STEHIDRAFT_116252 [Stereum hirsutum FP-91666 SS1]EIM79769.1 hypothetical protein STEHIDRAFT_116252 [Stereum hirsutum FP-91666 SS1]
MANRSNNMPQSQYQRRGKGKRSQARSNYNPYRRNPYYEFTSRFNANDTLDPFFTYVRPTYPPLRETQSNGRPLPVLHSTLDAYAASEDPSYIPMSQELLRADMFAMGANEDTLEKYMADHNKVVQDLLDRCGGHLPSRGRKPRPGVDEVMVYNIPNSDLAIRIWEGGMRDLGQYCLDLVSRARRGEVVNTPKAWKFTFVPLPGTFMPGGQLLPWETNFGIRELCALRLVSPAYDEDDWLEDTVTKGAHRASATASFRNWHVHLLSLVSAVLDTSSAVSHVNSPPSMYTTSDVDIGTADRLIFRHFFYLHKKQGILKGNYNGGFGVMER